MNYDFISEIEIIMIKYFLSFSPREFFLVQCFCITVAVVYCNFYYFIWLLFTDDSNHSFLLQILSRVLFWVNTLLSYFNICSMKHISAMTQFHNLQCFLPAQWRSITVTFIYLRFSSFFFGFYSWMSATTRFDHIIYWR